MRLSFYQKYKFFVMLLILVAIPMAFAEPMTADQAKIMVQGWLKTGNQPLQMALGTDLGEVETYRDQRGSNTYYIVYLKPQGFIVVPADDEIEPVIAFVAAGKYDPSPKKPLGALVSKDLAGRIFEVQLQKDAARMPVYAEAQKKWQRYLALAQDNSKGISSVSDERVAPMLTTQWSQQQVYQGLSSDYCYNYYAPNYYPCGCVATAMSQAMFYFKHPVAGVGTGSYTIYVNGSSQSANLRGGDDSGGAYLWTSMPNLPTTSATQAQRQAIGRLCHDAGLSVNMDYSASGSGANTLDVADALKSPFGYSNAIKGYNSGGNIGNGIYGMLNPNLDAARPVVLGVTGTLGGHAIVCDGYGYNNSTLYHHLNMGWHGSDDAWYNIPNLDPPGFSSVYKAIYNIYPSGAGEIVSGRVTASGAPISGATMTLTSRDGRIRATTTSNSKGIYAFDKVLSSTTYTVSASKSGYTFSDKPATTGSSVDNANSSGNVYDIDFIGGPGALDPPTLIAPNDNATIGTSTVVFQWNFVSEATTYWLWIAKAGTVIYSQGVGNVNSKAVGGFPLDGSTYTWQVWAGRFNKEGNGVWSPLSSSSLGKDSKRDGIWSPSSGIRSFTSYSPTPAELSLLTPTDGQRIPYSAITFSWTALTGATSYWLQVYSGDINLFYNAGVGNVTSKTILGFPINGTVYYWRVWAAMPNRGSGQRSPITRTGPAKTDRSWVPSATFSFINTMVPQTPTLVSPGNGATVGTSSVVFQWNFVPEATTYWLWIAKGNNVIYSKEVYNVNSKGVSKFPLDGSTYTWQVWAGRLSRASKRDGARNTLPPSNFKNGPKRDGSWSPSSGIRSFISYSPAPAAPGLVAPAHGTRIADSAITFSWTTVTGATSYWLQVYSGDFHLFYDADVGSLTSKTISGFPVDGTVYYWRLWAANHTRGDTQRPPKPTKTGLAKTDRSWGETSATFSFINTRAPLAPILLTPADGTTVDSSTITFEWDTSSGANEYWLQVNSDPNWSTGGMMFNAGVGNNTSRAVSGFSANTTYYWRVWAGNYSDSHAWSPTSATYTVIVSGLR